MGLSDDLRGLFSLLYWLWGWTEYVDYCAQRDAARRELNAVLAECDADGLVSDRLQRRRDAR